ncbi:MAG: hypothetical protein V1765_03095 [bacterium]
MSTLKEFADKTLAELGAYLDAQRILVQDKYQSATRELLLDLLDSMIKLMAQEIIKAEKDYQLRIKVASKIPSNSLKDNLTTRAAEVRDSQINWLIQIIKAEISGYQAQIKNFEVQ